MSKVNHTLPDYPWVVGILFICYVDHTVIKCLVEERGGLIHSG